MSAQMLDEVQIVLRQDMRELAYEMVRLERWAAEAAERRNFPRVAELHAQRDLARERRSALLRELWESRHA